MEMHEFVKFIENRSPGFSSRIMPAAEYLIEDVVTSAKHPLPKLYLDFLRSMGLESAEFAVRKMSFDPMDVADYVASDSSPPPDRFSLFALNVPDPGELYMHWYFDHANTSKSDCLVVTFEDIGSGTIEEGQIIPSYASFHELLLYWGFNIFSLRKQPFMHKLTLSCAATADGDRSKDTVRDCRAIAQRLGFKSVLPPTENCWTGESTDSSIMIYQLARPDARESLFVRVGTHEKQECLRICGVIEDNLERR